MTDQPSTSKCVLKKRPAEDAAPATSEQVTVKKCRLQGSGPFYEGDGLKHFLSGILYQINLLMLFMERGLHHGYTFMLASEVNAAEKFDDVVFRYEQNGKIKFRFLQAKHNSSKDKIQMITRNELIKKISIKKEKLAFSIQKYFLFYQKFKKLDKDYLKGDIEDFIICTNIDIDPKIQDNFSVETLTSETTDPLLTFESKYGTKKFKLKPKTQLFEEIYSILLEINSFYKILSEEIGTSIAKDKKKCETGKKNKNQTEKNTKNTLNEKDTQEILTFDYKKIFKENRHWIMQNILDPTTIRKVKYNKTEFTVVKFRNEFLENSTNEMTNIFLGAYIKLCAGVTKNQVISKFKGQDIKISPKLVEGIPQTYTEINFYEQHENYFYKSLVHAIGTSMATKKKPKKTTEKTINKKDIEGILSIDYRQIFQEYRHWIMQNILDPKTIKEIKPKQYVVKFRDEFLESSTSEVTNTFYKAYIKQQVGFTKDQVISKIKGQDIKVFPSLVEGISRTHNEIIHDDKNDEIQLKKDIYLFLKKLIFAVKVPSESQLKDVIHDDIANSMDLADGELVTSMVQTRIQDWLKQKNGKFLTHKDCKELFSDLKNIVACLAQIGFTLRYKTIIDKYGCTWKDGDLITRLNDFFKTHDNTNLLLVLYENDFLTKTKLMQLKKSAKCDELLFSDVTDYIYVFNTVACPVKALASNICDHMIMVLEDKKNVENSSYIDYKTKKLISSLLKLITNPQYFRKKIVIVMPYSPHKKFYVDVRDLLNKVKFKMVRDLENSYEDLSPQSQNKIQEQAKVYYKGCRVLFKDFHTTWEVSGEVLSNLIQGEYEPKIDERLDKYNYKTKKYYIDRHITNEDKSIELKNVYDLSNGITIITGDCGLGKSFLLSHLAEKTKEYQNEHRSENHNMCVIKANLHDYNDWLQTCEEKITLTKAAEFLYVVSRLESVDGITSQEVRFDFTADRQLTAQKYSLLSSEVPFSLKLFTLLYNHSKIVLLIDSYDEIAPQHVKKVTNLLKIFQEMRLNIICVATRPYNIAAKLEKALSCKKRRKYKKPVKSYKLTPLSKPEQVVLLKKYFREKKGPKIELKQLEKYCKSMQHVRVVKERSEVTDFLSSPQQLLMLAEIFSDENKISRQELNRKPLNRYTLYTKCVERYFSSEFNLPRPAYNREYDRKYKSFLKRHERFALLDLFRHMQLPMELVPRTSSRTLVAGLRKGEEKFGLLRSEVDESGTPQFWHRTYAEYFAARCLADAVYPINKHSNKTNIKEFVHSVMQNEDMSSLFHAFFNYRIIERTLDEYKAKNKRQRRKCKQNDEDSKENVIEFSQEDANTFEAAIEGDPKILHNEKLLHLRDALSRAPLHIFLYTASTKAILDYIASNNENVNSIKDKLFGWTPFQYFRSFHERDEGWEIPKEIRK